MLGAAIRWWRVAGTVALAVAACSACGSGGSSSSPPPSPPRTTAAPATVAHLPPWVTHQPIPPVGSNAAIWERFDDGRAENEGCRPIGTDPQIWTPNPGDEAGFAVQSVSPDGAQVSGDFTRAATWSTTYDDGSVAYVDDVPAGHLLFLALPTEQPSTWCVYAFTVPTDTPFRRMLSSMRSLAPPIRASGQT